MVLGHRHKHPTGPTGPTPAPTGPSAPSGPTAPPAPSGPSGPTPQAAVTARSGFRSLGNTDRASFRNALARSISGTSPMLAEADAIYDALSPDGLTRLAAVMAWIERKNDTYSGYYPQSYHNAWAVRGGGQNGFAQYISYAQAARKWRDLILGTTYQDIASLHDFIYRYAPPADGNDSAGYVQSVVDGVNALPLLGGVSPSGPTGPAPEPVDPIAVIVGGSYPPVTYGFRSDVGIPSYKFGVGHGTTAITQHTGYDVGVPRGTHLFTPLPGVVRCVGYDGTPDWGQSCGAYDDDKGGPGNITIMLDGVYRGSQVKLTLGHCSAAVVRPGQRVQAGEQVGRSGGSDGEHVHVETSIDAPDLVDNAHTYYPGLPFFLIDPGIALAAAMGGSVVLPVVYAPVRPVPQPEDLDTFATVTVTAESVPVLQYANLAAPKVMPDIPKGETFESAFQVMADDGTLWWIGRYHGRVPVAGTKAPEWKS